MKSFGAALLLCLSAEAAEIEITPLEKPTFVFAGQKQTVRLVITNSGPQRNIELAYRVFQVAGPVAAPVGARTHWKAIQMNSGQAVLEGLPMSFPEVKAQTTFAVQLFEGDARVGAVTVEALPSNLLAQLKEKTAGFQWAVFDPKRRVSSAIEKAGLELLSVKDTSSPILADKPILLILAEAVEEGELADFSKVADVIVEIGSNRRPSMDHLAIEGKPKNKAFVVSVDSALLSDFPNSAQAQLNFMRAVQYALRRGGSSISRE
jgi:hypothetical protein